jgi:hypothetical protein
MSHQKEVRRDIRYLYFLPVLPGRPSTVYFVLYPSLSICMAQMAQTEMVEIPMKSYSLFDRLLSLVCRYARISDRSLSMKHDGFPYAVSPLSPPNGAVVPQL